MDHFHFSQNSVWIYLWLLPLVWAGLIWAYRRKERLLQQFADSALLKQLCQPGNWNIRWLKIVLFSLGLIAIVAALARPRAGLYYEEVEQRGRDIVVLLDISKSMLAEDVRPNRLKRAKADVKDLLKVAKGDRIALVAFAGKVEVRCPLTLDYNFFAWALEECYPGTVVRGGTAIGDAIRKGLELLTPSSVGSATPKEGASLRNKSMILITDGEDHQTAPLQAASVAKENNIKILTIGLGDPESGARIPLVDRQGNVYYQTDAQGAIVWSKLDSELLRQIAKATQGGYLQAGTHNINMAEIYQNYIAQLDTQKFQGSRQKKYGELFQVFVFLALLFFWIEGMIQEGTLKLQRVKYVAFLTALTLFTVSCQDREVSALMDKAKELYQQQKYQQAQQSYQQLQDKVAADDQEVVLYNQANAAYQNQQWQQAVSHYQKVIQSGKGSQQQRFDCFFNLGCAYYQQALSLVASANNQPQSKETLQQTVDLLISSLKNFRQALEIFPQHEQTLFHLQLAKAKLAHFRQQLQQQEQKSQEDNFLAILTKFLKAQRKLLRQTRLLTEKDPSQLQKLQPSQQELLIWLDKFYDKFSQQMAKLASQSQSLPGNLPGGAAQVSPKQMEQMAKLADQAVQQARELLELSEQQLAQNKPDAAKKQRQALELLSPIWQVLAQEQLLLQEDLRLQQQTLKDTENLLEQDSHNSPVPLKWPWLAETQQDAHALTNMVQKKGQAIKQALAQLQPQQQPAQENASEQQKQQLLTQALQEQKQALALLEQAQGQPSVAHQQKAIEILKKLLQSEQNQEKQNKQQQDQQQQKQKQKQKQKQQKQQQKQKQQEQSQKQKQQTPPSPQPKEKKQKMSKEEIQRLLQQVKEREKQRKEQKKQELLLQGEKGVQRDW